MDSYGDSEQLVDSPGAYESDGHEDFLHDSNSKSAKRRNSSRDMETRKAQNRQAQRDFRQRKQQYVKDLEAKLELYSATHDDQVESLRRAMHMLIKENHELRGLVRTLAKFLGDGVGGVLTTIGRDHSEFQALIDRHETELVRDALKDDKARHAVLAGTSNGSKDSSRKHSRPSSPSLSRAGSNAPSDANGGKQGKRVRHAADTPPLSTTTSAAASTSAQVDSSTTLDAVNQASLPDPSATPLDLLAFYGSGLDAAFSMPSLDLPSSASSALPSSLPAPTLPPQPQNAFHGTSRAVIDALRTEAEQRLEAKAPFEENANLQALRLISYHMKNKRENPLYALPPALRWTPIQEQIVHDPMYDAIPFSSLRDRLILCKDQHDVVTLFRDFGEACTLHTREGGDVLDPRNWELSEPFLRKYYYVIDQEVIDIANHWRRQRGDKRLELGQLLPPPATSRAYP